MEEAVKGTWIRSVSLEQMDRDGAYGFIRSLRYTGAAGFFSAL